MSCFQSFIPLLYTLVEWRQVKNRQFYHHCLWRIHIYLNRVEYIVRKIVKIVNIMQKKKVPPSILSLKTSLNPMFITVPIRDGNKLLNTRTWVIIKLKAYYVIFVCSILCVQIYKRRLKNVSVCQKDTGCGTEIKVRIFFLWTVWTN